MKHPPAFRRKVVRAYEKGPLSIYQTAQKYGISPSTLHRWLDRDSVPTKDSGESANKLDNGQWVLDPKRRIQVWQKHVA